ncbi:DNA polymerase III subunit gamma/tau [Myxococcota bacterium]|nr:DNA polymerase III subunit gamma/tau [Myxococcota bacterium]
MSYLVLARKWRPQRFGEVIAQPHVVQALQNAIKLDRLPHALLLTGSRGVGKTTIARLVAKTVNCLKADREELEPCNCCDLCVEITEGRSVDVIEIDGASNRSIDDIRELRDNVQYTPTKGKRKVHIIDEVHMLTREAFNALLKTLEEPPPHVMFIFATTEPHKIPVTILSRCQRFDFKRIPTTVLRDHLRRIAKAEGIQLSETALAMVARAAQGGARDAMSLMDQVIAFGGESPKDEAVAQAIGVINRQIMMEIGQALLSKDAGACLRAVDALFYFAYDLRQFTQELSAFLRDMMVVRICQDTEGIVDLTEEELAALRRLVQPEEPERIQQIFRILTQAAEEIAQSNHPRLLLEMTLIRMARVEPVRPFEDLISQLSSLEGRLMGLAQDDPSQMRIPPSPLALETSLLSNPNGGGASIHAHLQRSLQSGLATPEHLASPSHSTFSDTSAPSVPRSPQQAVETARFGTPQQTVGSAVSNTPQQAVGSMISMPAQQAAGSAVSGPSHQSIAASTSDISQTAAATARSPNAHTSVHSSLGATIPSVVPAFGDDYLAATSERPTASLPTSPSMSVAAPASEMRSPKPVSDNEARETKPAPPETKPAPPDNSAPSRPANASSSEKSLARSAASSHKKADNSARAKDEFSSNVWSRLIHSLAKEQAFLAGSLRSMAYRVEGEQLLLAYPPYAVQELDESKRQNLERFLRGQGWPLTVRFVKVNAEQQREFSPCLEDAKALRERERQQALEEEVRQHDATRAILRVIPNAEIVRVTPLVLDETEASSEDEAEP